MNRGRLPEWRPAVGGSWDDSFVFFRICSLWWTGRFAEITWKVLILRDLMDGTKRFGELKKSIGTVSQKVLTAQLRDMEEKGLLTSKVYAEVPPRGEYTLTETGYSLKPVLDAMWAWGADYQAKNG